MWKTEIMAERRNDIFVDLRATEESVPITNLPLAPAAISTAPAIVHMLMTPKTRAPNKPSSPLEHIPKTMPQHDPNVFRIQRDFNSPSAALHLRAMRALKSPNRTPYSNFDVSHTEQSIITAEERNPSPTPTLSEILKDVIVYVEVRTGNDNRSEGVKSIIAKLGAQVNDRLLRNTTHVVFKDGLLSTYKRAQSWDVPIVSILWIEACKVQRRLCDPKQFPISNIHMYEYPELYGKLPRVRCMQPDSELNKRPRKLQGTPTGLKDKENAKKLTATPTNTPKNEITRFFKPLGKHLAEDEAPESPATKLLNRMTNGCFTPVNMPNRQAGGGATAQEVEPNAIGDVVAKTKAQNSLSFQKDQGKGRPRSSSLTVQSPPVRTTRRSSSVHALETPKNKQDKIQFEPYMTRRRSLLAMSATEQTDVEETQPAELPSRTRRRSSFQLPAESPIIPIELQSPAERRRRSVLTTTNTEPNTQKLLKKPSFQVIAEEPLVETTACTNNQTNYVQQSMQISPSYAHIISKATRRRTLYTTEYMHISELSNENQNPYLVENISQNRLGNVSKESSRDSFVSLKTSPESDEQQTPVPVFSSTRLPGSNSSSTHRRRTLFNMDMDLINERINNINNSAQKRSLEMASDAELGECRNPLVLLAPLQAVEAAEEGQAKSTEPKMRRLFTPNEEIIVSPVKKSRKSIAASSITGSSGSSAAKRRRTLGVPRPTVAVGPIIQKDVETSTESDPTKDNSVSPTTSDTTADSASDAPAVVKRKRNAPKRRITMHTLVHTNMHKEQVQVIHKAVHKLPGMRLDPTVTKRTTHLVSLEPRRTLNLLRGLMRGVWIVNYKWILESLRAGKWINEEKYELTSFSRAIEICRTERQAFGISYRCELFRYMETFYVSSLCRPITFNNIKELLLLGGAKLTENRYKAKFIIGDKRRAEDDRIYLTPTWVLDSITAMQIQKFGSYLMKSAIVTPYGIRYEDPPEDKSQRNARVVCYRDPALVINK